MPKPCQDAEEHVEAIADVEGLRLRPLVKEAASSMQGNGGVSVGGSRRRRRNFDLPQFCLTVSELWGF